MNVCRKGRVNVDDENGISSGKIGSNYHRNRIHSESLTRNAVTILCVVLECVTVEEEWLLSPNDFDAVKEDKKDC